MIYDVPDTFDVALRQIHPEMDDLVQVRVYGIPVAYATLRPGSEIMLIAKCTDGILDAVRKRLESEAGGAMGAFTATPQMVDDERERYEESTSCEDDEEDSPLWLPTSFER